jgi:hypothetical protein
MLCELCGDTSVTNAVGHIGEFDVIVGDPYSLGGAASLGMRVLVICSAVLIFGQEMKHTFTYVIFGISEGCWSNGIDIKEYHC